MATSVTDPAKLQREVLDQDQDPGKEKGGLEEGVGASLAQLQLEKKEEEKCEFGRCPICCKDSDHISFACPYWYGGIPEGATVGPGYGVVCGCYDLGGAVHPGRKGRLIVAYCAYCNISALHCPEDCPERPRDRPYSIRPVLGEVMF